MQNIVYNVQDRNSMYVVESALLHCAHADQQALIASILGHRMQNLPIYTRCLPGIQILRALVKLEFEQSNEFYDHLQWLTPQIRKHNQGHRLLQDMNAIKRGTA